MLWRPIETWTDGAKKASCVIYKKIRHSRAKDALQPQIWAILERVANLYASLGWPAHASGDAITAEYSAPSAGRGPWDLYEVAPDAAVGVATREPHGATRWRFDM